MARESRLSVIADNCLWLICQAVKAAGGTSGSATIDAEVDTYILTQDADIGERLVLDQLAVYNGDPNSFPDFFEAYVTALNALLVHFNWLASGAGTSSPANHTWNGRTTLGEMVKHLVNEFSGKVIFKP